MKFEQLSKFLETMAAEMSIEELSIEELEAKLAQLKMAKKESTKREKIVMPTIKFTLQLLDEMKHGMCDICGSFKGVIAEFLREPKYMPRMRECRWRMCEVCFNKDYDLEDVHDYLMTKGSDHGSSSMSHYLSSKKN